MQADECMQWAVVCIHIKRGGGIQALAVSEVDRNAAPRIEGVGFHGDDVDRQVG